MAKQKSKWQNCDLKKKILKKNSKICFFKHEEGPNDRPTKISINRKYLSKSILMIRAHGDFRYLQSMCHVRVQSCKKCYFKKKKSVVQCLQLP